MGRLEDIIQRNRGEHRNRDRIALGLKGLVLLLIIGLIIFSDLALNDEQRAAKEAAERQAREPATPHVDGIKLYRSPGGSGSGSGSGSQAR